MALLTTRGVKVVLVDRSGDPTATAEGVRHVALELGIEVTVEAHPNGVVDAGTTACLGEDKFRCGPVSCVHEGSVTGGTPRFR